MSELIDWEELRVGVNNRYGTSYPTVAAMIAGLYYDTEAEYKIAEILGVGKSTLWVYRRKNNIILPSILDLKAQKVGYFNFDDAIKKLYGQMYTREISQILNVCKNSVSDHAKKLGFQMKRGTPHGYKRAKNNRRISGSALLRMQRKTLDGNP